LQLPLLLLRAAVRGPAAVVLPCVVAAARLHGWGCWLRAGCYCVALLLAVPPLAASNIWSRR
jgi:hypothetical protein